MKFRAVVICRMLSEQSSWQRCLWNGKPQTMVKAFEGKSKEEVLETMNPCYEFVRWCES